MFYSLLCLLLLDVLIGCVSYSFQNSLNFYLFVISDNQSFISQILKRKSLGRKVGIFQSLEIKIQSNFRNCQILSEN